MGQDPSYMIIPNEQETQRKDNKSKTEKCNEKIGDCPHLRRKNKGAIFIYDTRLREKN